MREKARLHSRQVKVRLLPLSRLESILEWFVEQLPRQLVRIELSPNDDIAVINESQGDYKATGYAPRFAMNFAPAVARGGWYYLEAALVRNNGSREACLCADTGTGSTGSITIPIPANLRGTVREVFFLPANVTTISWLPTAAPGFFSQSPLLVHKITSVESTLRRLYRVFNDLWRFRGRTPAARFGLTWREAIRKPQEAYLRTANLRIKRLIGNDYPTFLALNDPLKSTGIHALQKQVLQLSFHPRISLIMPVQSPVPEFFGGALNSVLGQIYPYWELLLAGDIPADHHNLEIVKTYQSKNAQVRLIQVPSGTDLAATLNRGLAQAQGEFVARIDQHDQIPPYALLFLVREINKHPDADLLYTDDDSIDDINKRSAPRFKPDWNPDLFFSYNYLAHLTLYRQAHALGLGGYRSGFVGAEDYDLLLRYLKDIPATKIRHIPMVLYHSHVASQPSTSMPSTLHGENWDECLPHQSGKRALVDHLKDEGIIVLDGPAPGLYQIQHPLPAPPPLVSIIIPTRDRVDILKQCIKSIQQKTDYENWEMLVVDNHSVEQETLAYLEQIQSDRIKIFRYEKPFNYSAMNNYAVRYAQGEILALVNNDIEVITKEWLTEMVSHAMRPEIGAVGAKLLYANGLVQHAGVILGLGGVAGHAHKYLKEDVHGYCHRAVVVQNISAVTGACLVVRKSCYQEVGGLNEVNLAVAFNDVDFCMKLITAGYRNLYTPYARLYHHESISRGYDNTVEKQRIFREEFNYMRKKLGDSLINDPAYNPNLTSEFENFSF